MQRTNPNYTLIATMTDMRDSHESWAGETGLIDAAMLANYADAARNGIYYITGPPGMVRALQAVLKTAGVHDEDIRVEEYRACGDLRGNSANA